LTIIIVVLGILCPLHPEVIFFPLITIDVLLLWQQIFRNIHSPSFGIDGSRMDDSADTQRQVSSTFKKVDGLLKFLRAQPRHMIIECVYRPSIWTKPCVPIPTIL
jgi:hypothetical protein